jgi:hypothetical protein
MFLSMAEGNRKILKKSYVSRRIKGINIRPSCNITHLLFVDDILILCEGTRESMAYLYGLLNLFYEATCMNISREKYPLIILGLSDLERNNINQLLSFQVGVFESRLKYLCFFSF